MMGNLRGNLHNVSLTSRNRATCADPGIFVRGVQVRRPENVFDNVFCLFLVLNLFYSLQRGSNGFITEKINNFPWIQHFSEGGGGCVIQMLFSIETHITCDFQGGGLDSISPPPPSGSAHGLGDLEHVITFLTIYSTQAPFDAFEM